MDENKAVNESIQEDESLLLDMKILAALDESINELKKHEAEVQADINALAAEKGWDLQLKDIQGTLKEAQAQFGKIKADITFRGIEISKASGYENRHPCLGVLITENTNRILNVDHAEAIEWSVINNYQTLLLLNEEKYADLLEAAVMPDQPGSLDKTPVYKAKISLKPFQEAGG